MLRPGAIAARCTELPQREPASGGAGGAGGIPGWPDDSYHGGQHTDGLDCALCHTETVISCVNCHLEEDVDNGVKCASAQVFNWKFVMKWDKEGDGNEVFHPATIMTVKYNCDRPQTDPPFAACPNPDDGKKTIAVFAPYYAHTVTETGDGQHPERARQDRPRMARARLRRTAMAPRTATRSSPRMPITGRS